MKGRLKRCASWRSAFLNIRDFFTADFTKLLVKTLIVSNSIVAVRDVHSKGSELELVRMLLGWSVENQP